ncbi:hypothetical protein [Streptomyces xantholiticus]|uniref:hypothetical protein n=1 Tax=Streptomyces xantholiticus TaxID=68285 RepID=UPI001675D260|nr:hypothetical protein [Streptomyces xantholiticus]GGW53876.1 hypothetical protein GCM10010381_44210 [Streptomyces xantholiticus]
MGLFRRLTGTRHPEAGVAPLAAAELRTALLALNGPDVPYRVRNALPKEKADLVAEWRLLEPATGVSFARKQVERTIRTRMRLVPDKHEVRTLDEQWEVTRIGDPPGLTTSRTYGRGPATTVHREWTYEKGADGRRHKVETFHFDSRDMKNPLRNAVLGGGWTWRGVLFKW